jgi:hypothetical protein
VIFVSYWYKSWLIQHWCQLYRVHLFFSMYHISYILISFCIFRPRFTITENRPWILLIESCIAGPSNQVVGPYRFSLSSFFSFSFLLQNPLLVLFTFFWHKADESFSITHTLDQNVHRYFGTDIASIICSHLKCVRIQKLLPKICVADALICS